MALQAHVLGGVASGAEQGRRNGRPLWGALDVPVQTSDGHVAVSASDDDLRLLCELCGVDADGRLRHDLEQEVAKSMAGDRTAAWAQRLGDAGIGCEPVATDLTAVAADPRLASLFEPLAAQCRAPASPWLLTT